MRRVSRFEADLLEILHAILGRAPAEEALIKVVRRSPRPACLGRDTVELVQDALAKGCVHLLARQGGWQVDTFLRGERASAGRLWDRTAPTDLGLSFSPHSLDFLIWLTADHPGTPWDPPAGDLTVGDLVLLYFAYESFRSTGVARDLLSRPQLSRNALCHLAFPDDLAEIGAGHEPEMAPWVSGVGACVLEALQGRLAGRWASIERQKGRLRDGATMRRLGAAQARALDAFLAAVEGANRRDLARFLMVAVADLLRHDPKPRAWIGALDLKGQRLADRAETYRAAAALLQRFDRLASWEAEARTTGYFDEGYQAAQLYKGNWERLGGETLRTRVAALVRELEPLSI